MADSAPTTIISKFNQFLAFVGAGPEQAAVDAWAIGIIATFLENQPAIPANIAPLIPLYVASLYVDAGLPVPAGLLPAAPPA